MKIAISIDNDLLREADETARVMGVSRSRVISLAVGEFLKRQRESQMLQQLNEVYAGGLDAEKKRLVKSIMARVGRTVKDRW